MHMRVFLQQKSWLSSYDKIFMSHHHLLLLSVGRFVYDKNWKVGGREKAVTNKNNCALFSALFSLNLSSTNEMSSEMIFAAPQR